MRVTASRIAALAALAWVITALVVAFTMGFVPLFFIALASAVLLVGVGLLFWLIENEDRL